MRKEINTVGLLVFIIILFLTLALPLLTKDPVVFPDEVFISNNAYSFIDKESFSLTPFSSRLPIIEKETFVVYGPVYYWTIAPFLKIFGLSITTVRLTSVLIGALSLIAVFLLAKNIFQNSNLGLLTMFLLSIDYNFLRSARFCRPEILVMLLTYLAFLFYFKTLQKPSFKNYLLTGIFLSLGFFTHFFMGAVAPVVIFFHLLWNKESSLKMAKKIFYLYLIPALCILGWWLYLHYFTDNLAKSLAFISIFDRIKIGFSFSAGFYSLKSILRGDYLIKALFLIYFTIFPLLLLNAKGNRIKGFLILNYLITFLIVFYGGSGWYLGLLPFPVYLTIAFVKKLAKQNLYRYFWFSLIVVLIIINLSEQIRLNNFYRQYSYADFSQKIADYLPENSKVFLRQLMPDPYLYLAEKRKDLKLASEQFFDSDQSNFKISLQQADYLVTYGIDYQALLIWQQLKAANDSSRETKLQQLIQNYNLNPVLINYLKERQSEVFLVKGSQFYSPIAIFKIKKDN